MSLFLELHENNSLATTTDIQAFGDPDILVLGFQELDLSTEALLYTTSTLKEDEWLTAIFAGLGEKRVLYEKVHPHHRNQTSVDENWVPIACFKTTRRHATHSDCKESPCPLFH